MLLLPSPLPLRRNHVTCARTAVPDVVPRRGVPIQHLTSQRCIDNASVWAAISPRRRPAACTLVSLLPCRSHQFQYVSTHRSPLHSSVHGSILLASRDGVRWNVLETSQKDDCRLWNTTVSRSVTDVKCAHDGRQSEDACCITSGTQVFRGMPAPWVARDENGQALGDCCAPCNVPR